MRHSIFPCAFVAETETAVSVVRLRRKHADMSVSALLRKVSKRLITCHSPVRRDIMVTPVRMIQLDDVSGRIITLQCLHIRIAVIIDHDHTVRLETALSELFRRNKQVKAEIDGTE